jgi:integrase
MPRPNNIWFRKDIGWWMVTLGGHKVRLAQGRESKKEAERKFHELKAVTPKAPESESARAADLIESFLEWAKIHRSPETCRNLVWYGQAFAERCGYLLASDIRPIHLTRWIATKNWNQTTEHNARRSIYRAFAWATEEGLLQNNPLKGMRCPRAKSRQRALTDDEFRVLLRHSHRNFKVLLFALRETGCRPKEARTLRWTNVFEDRWVLTEHKTVGKTNRPRVIFLNLPMRKLMSVLRRQNNEHVFLNDHGKPWTANAMRLRIARIKKRVPLAQDVCPYLLRHAFGTNAIINGVDPITVANLMGHTSLEMINTVYAHLADKHIHLQQAIERATGRLASSKPPQGDQAGAE